MFKSCNFKRLSSLLIAFAIVFTVFAIQITASATENEGVIQLSIYAFEAGSSSGSSNGGGWGHAWLVIENGTDDEYDFYNTTISAGETVSIGTWGNMEDPDTGNLYKGAWLNLEAYYGWGTHNTVSLTITITAEQLYTVSEKCIDMNNWTAVNNCSYFASKVWNSVAPEDMHVNSYFFPANFPAILMDNIQEIDGYQSNRAFGYNDYIGYCSDDDTFKHIELNRLTSGSSSNNSSVMSSRSIGHCCTSFPEECIQMTPYEFVQKILRDIHEQEGGKKIYE